MLTPTSRTSKTRLGLVRLPGFLVFSVLVWSLTLALTGLSAVPALGAQVTLAWDANTEPHLAGYRLYSGPASRSYTQNIDVGNQTTHALTVPGGSETVYFAVTAYDTHGRESDFSEEVIWTASVTEHTITASAGAGGSIAPSGSVLVASGNSVTFTITPGEGFAIQDVLVNGASVGSQPTYTFTNVTSDQSILASFSQVMEYGSVQATIEPSGARDAGAQWRLTTGPDTQWKSSGTTVEDIPAGSYTVEFNDLDGWTKPSAQSVAVTKDNTALATGVYTTSQVMEYGSVQATIEPAGARDAGAQWRLTSGPDTQWKSSGTTVEDIPAGSYTVEFNNLDGWTKPSAQSVAVTKDNTALATGVYTTGQQSGQITLAWDANTEPHLAGYRLYSGPASRSYTQNVDVGNQTTHALTVPGGTEILYLAVTAYDTHGRESDFSEEVIWTASVHQPEPFTVDPDTGPAPLAVTFTASEPIDPAATYSWSFGDGGTAAGASAAHTYATPGSYTASLTISCASCTPVVHTATITVTAAATQPEPPVAVIEPSEVHGDTSSAVSLDGSGSHDPDGGEIVSWQWHMGDGTAKTGTQITHQYIVNGTYQASLTVTNALGATASTSVPVVIAASSSDPDEPPTAVIDASKRKGKPPLKVRFSGTQSQAADGGEIVSYQWDFGDGTVASGPEVEHTFEFEAEYTVALEATDNRGAKGTATTTIVANSADRPNIVPVLMLLLLGGDDDQGAAGHGQP